MRSLLLVALVSLGGCGAAPDKPLLANAPRPDQTHVAGAAAAVSAAIVLASPDVTRTPEQNKDAEKAPVRVKESVPGDVLDRLDRKPAESGDGATNATPDATKAQPSKDTAKARDTTKDGTKATTKPTPDATKPTPTQDPPDFSSVNLKLKRN